MREFLWSQIDVFSEAPLRGNPVAVVHGASSLSDAEMQQIAAWTNLSETTFLLPARDPGASYRLRIFTPRAELPFAGHPTIGSAHAARVSGLVGAGPLVQECGAGLVPLRVEEGSPTLIFARAPKANARPISAEAARRLAEALGTVPVGADPRVIEVGPRWLIAQVSSEDELHRLQPRMEALSTFSDEEHITGVTLFSLASGEAPVYVRSFAPAHGVPEDPVCGSGNASVGAFLRETGLLSNVGTRYVARQGHELGRAGRVSLVVEDGAIEIGGSCVTTLTGTFRLPV
jgi:PhzF family phenazine biosynthesis protein